MSFEISWSENQVLPLLSSVPLHYQSFCDDISSFVWTSSKFSIICRNFRGNQIGDRNISIINNFSVLENLLFRNRKPLADLEN